MKANLPLREPEVAARWEAGRHYEAVQDSRTGRPKFILHDGPPYTNGPIHLGQALNKILKDIVVKYKTLAGFDAPFVPGWDTHGLPNEIAAIKAFQLNRKAIDPVALRAKCAESARHFVDVQRDQFKRLGIRGDWDHPYLTLDHAYEATVVRVFGAMARAGLIYRGLKPVYWCPTCETALAEAEIEYKEKTSPSIYVRFFLKDEERAELLDTFNVSDSPDLPARIAVLIWTTTPWTLPANQAIAVHPGGSYALVRIEGSQGDELAVIAEALTAPVAAALGWPSPTVLGTAPGEDLKGFDCRHPFLPRDSVVILEDYVLLDAAEEGAGTGCVHTAPGHGQEDFDAGMEYNLPVIVPVDGRGVLTDEAGPFAGLKIEDANPKIIAALAASGHLAWQGTVRHSYAHCWRCHNPVIYRATEQWFAAMDVGDLRHKALGAIQKVRWIPSWGQERIANMVKDRPDWTLSRQRIWGVPIPALWCAGCRTPLFGEEIIGVVERIFREEGADAWYRRPAADFAPAEYACPRCGGAAFEKDSDIFDVWFESGVSHEAVLRRPELAWPADLYLEGNDQHRGWFQASLLACAGSRDKAPYAPYKTALTHGWVLDAKGNAMHKSAGNVVDPMEVVDRYGADVLRLFIASVDYTADMRVGKEALEQVSEVYRKIRNTFRYIVGNLFDFEPDQHALSDESLLPLERWALQGSSELLAGLKAKYDAYDFHQVYSYLQNFCSIDLSSLYFDVLKDRLYTAPPGSIARRSAQTALFRIGRDLCIAMAPILSFTAEEVWAMLPAWQDKAASPEIAWWPDGPASLLSEEEKTDWERLLAVRQDVYKVIEDSRKSNAIKQSLETRVCLFLSPEGESAQQPSLTAAEMNMTSKPLEETLKEYFDQLSALFIVSDVSMQSFDQPITGNWQRSSTYPQLAIMVERHPGGKCPRCWKYFETLSGDSAYPDVCAFCAAAVGNIVSNA